MEKGERAYEGLYKCHSGLDGKLEKRIFKIGKKIYDNSKFHLPMLLSCRWIDDKIFDICTGNKETKKSLFGLIDVYPSLKETVEVKKHVEEYLLDSGVELPFLIKKGLGFANLSKLILERAVRGGIERTANRFIAGATMKDAEKSIKRILGSGMMFTLDILGEKVVSEAESASYMQAYLSALDSLSKVFGERRDKYGNPLINISVKLSSFYSQFNPVDQSGTSEAVKLKLGRIFEKAMEVGAFVNVDIEDYYKRDISFKIFKELLEEERFKNFYDAGIVVQAYLRDSEDSLRKLIVWSREKERRIGVRLVKGAYWDHEVMLLEKNGWGASSEKEYVFKESVFTKKYESDINFENLTRILFEEHEGGIAIASHNIRSIAHAIAVAEKLNVDKGRFELQMLYGLGEPIKEALVGDGRRLRVYVPCGELIPGMGYLVRRLLENTANDSFLLGFENNVDAVKLLQNPYDVLLIQKKAKEEESGQKN